MMTSQWHVTTIGLSVVLWALVGLQVTEAGIVPSYCQWETFNATCPDDHVILMTFAEYGRMRVGRCLSTDYYTGCQANVIDHMDERCSGRQRCTIRIPDPKLSVVQPCRKDLVAYLEADYDCVPVLDPAAGRNKKTYCRGPIDLTYKTMGYILSSVTAKTGLGSRNCPWLIKAKPGQRINVTVYDFSSRSRTDDVAKKSLIQGTASKAICPVYATLSEGGKMFGGVLDTTRIGICGSEKRRRWVYTSRGSSLSVKMVNMSADSAKNINFMLKYEVIGCADLVNPTGAYMERKGDSLIISCNNTQETWHLVCKGNTWIGDYRNCTSAHNKMAVGDVGREEEGFPLGLLVAIAIGVVVGVVLGFVFLIGIFICRRRNRQDMKQDSGNPLMSGHGLDPDQQNIYRLVEVRPPPPMMCECHLAADPKAIPAMDNKVGIPANPGEYLYGTTPTIELADLDYPAPDVDSRQGQIAQPLKPCDIISDIHVTDGVRCCSNGRDCYGIGRNLRSQTDTYPRIKPLPPYSADRRLSSRLARVPGEVKDGTDTPIYEARQ